VKIEIWHVGKTRQPWMREGQKVLLGKCSRYVKIETVLVHPEKSNNEDHIRNRESERILEKLKSAGRGYTILLDEIGLAQTSREFAHNLSAIFDRGIPVIRFIIGGAYGVNFDVKETVNQALSLSSMTFPHELVRLIFLEQLYRGFTILRGESYHHD